VLGVAPEASQDDIRRAYHAKVREVHPDRVAGASLEIRKLAEERTAELNAAYRALVRR
jgi:DnaJ like chaperone protein